MGLHQGDFLEKNASAGRRRGQAGPGVFFSRILVANVGECKREEIAGSSWGPARERAVNQVGERLRGFLGNVEQTIDG